MSLHSPLKNIFKAGDMVMSSYDASNGKIGVIIGTVNDEYEVDFEGEIFGHGGTSENRCLRSRYFIPESKLTLVNPITNLTKETMPTSKKSICEINFTRVAGEQLLFIKTTKEIADLFKCPTGVAVSENYLDKDGEKLKYQKTIDQLEVYVQKFRQQSYSMNCKLDRYGTNLMVDGCYNFSILRTKDIVNGVTVKVGDLILEDDVTNWGQALGAFIKFLHRNYIDRVEVKINISMEI